MYHCSTLFCAPNVADFLWIKLLYKNVIFFFNGYILWCWTTKQNESPMLDIKIIYSGSLF